MDGLTAQWKEGVERPEGAACSDYMGDMGEHAEEDRGRTAAMHANDTENMEYDTSGMGRGNVDEDVSESEWINDMDEAGWVPVNDAAAPAPTTAAPAPSRTKHINELGFDKFRGRLINHFNYMWQQRQVVWPSRTGTGIPYGWDQDMLV